MIRSARGFALVKTLSRSFQEDDCSGPRPWITILASLMTLGLIPAAEKRGNTEQNWALAWWHDHMKTFPRYWLFVRGIHRSPVDSPHKGQWRGALMLYLICAWTNGWTNNRDADDLRRHRAYYDVTVTSPHCHCMIAFLETERSSCEWHRHFPKPPGARIPKRSTCFYAVLVTIGMVNSACRMLM